MSSGVSEQMKIPGNAAAKNGEERNIPWSQQVDEAFYENLASPIDDNTATNTSSTKFQYPPFNAKENQQQTSGTWDNNYKQRKPSNNFENKKYGGKPALYNNTKRDDIQPNAWGTNNSRRIGSDNAAGNLFRANRPDDGYIAGKLDNRPNVATNEEKKGNKAPIAAAPKKTTWASIASQPAKLTSRTTLTTSSHKKKGPGMPPPPMVPGKHNLDVHTWDLPNNNPPLVPSPPPPPVDIAQAVETQPDISTSFVAESNYVEGRANDKAYKTEETFKDDNKTNYNSNSNSNYGRGRHSPNGHSRKNWSTQHPLHQNPSRQTQPPPHAQSGGVGRRNESYASGESNRYVERRNPYPNTRQEQSGGSHGSSQDFKDENSPQIVDKPTVVAELTEETSPAVLAELRGKNNYNPVELDLEIAARARFFVIKSYSEDDIHRSIKYAIWCSTDHGNKRLDDAFKERQQESGHVLLFFSVNGSGHFCGMAQMMTAVDYNSTSSVWSQDKWKGKIKVKWIYVKDVPNIHLRHIRLENNENKSVTHSRDTQEVPNDKGIEVLQILHSFINKTSIFDDFYHYEKKQEEEVSSKKPLAPDNTNHAQNQSPLSRQYNRPQNDERDRDIRGGSQQRYFGGGNGGSGGRDGGGREGGDRNYRDRNTSHRGYHNNYSEYRRPFDSNRSAGDYLQKEKDDADALLPNRENSDYNSRHTQKFDYGRRNDRAMAKPNNRERDFADDQNKGETRFRAGPREIYNKDNEHPIAERNRDTDY